MKIKCPKCNYRWKTNSKLDFVTCPNCQMKVKKKEISRTNENESTHK